MSKKWKRSKVLKGNKLIALQWSRGEPWYRPFCTVVANGLSRLLRPFREQD
jgi:hypothetical protein